jgi:hypothetical protein
MKNRIVGAEFFCGADRQTDRCDEGGIAVHNFVTALKNGNIRST